MMKHRMHSYIFFPVFLVIIFWTIASWLIFAASCGWYGNHTAQRRAAVMMRMIRAKAGDESVRARIQESDSPADQHVYVRDLMSDIGQELRSSNYSANLIVLDSGLEQVYASENLSPLAAKEIQEQVSGYILQNSVEDSGETRVSIAENDWLVRIFSLGFDTPVQAQYFLVCVPEPNLTVLLSSVKNLIFLIALLCVGLGGGMVWILGKRLSNPIEQLCRQTEEISQGKYEPIAGSYPVTELEQLKNAFNQMGEQLKQAEEQNMHFFQNVSHDLRTPLAAISGYAQGIQCGVVKEPQKAAKIILSESMRLTNMVETLLTLSRMERNEQPLHMVSVNLEEFLEQELELLRGAADGRDLILAKGDESLTALLDPELFARVLQNAVSNGLRYSKTQVRLSFQAREWGAEVLVEDDGPGFSPQDLAHLNQRFYKGEKGNWGIGISVISSAMEYMGGEAQMGNLAPPRQGAFYRLLLNSPENAKNQFRTADLEFSTPP